MNFIDGNQSIFDIAYTIFSRVLVAMFDLRRDPLSRLIVKKKIYYGEKIFPEENDEILNDEILYFEEVEENNLVEL